MRAERRGGGGGDGNDASGGSSIAFGLEEGRGTRGYTTSVGSIPGVKNDTTHIIHTPCQREERTFAKRRGRDVTFGIDPNVALKTGGSFSIGRVRPTNPR